MTNFTKIFNYIKSLCKNNQHILIEEFRRFLVWVLRDSLNCIKSSSITVLGSKCLEIPIIYIYYKKKSTHFNWRILTQILLLQYCDNLSPKVIQEKTTKLTRIFELYQVFLQQNVLVLPYCMLLTRTKSIFNFS